MMAAGDMAKQHGNNAAHAAPGSGGLGGLLGGLLGGGHASSSQGGMAGKLMR